MIIRKFLPIEYLFDKIKIPFFIVLFGATVFDLLPLILEDRLPGHRYPYSPVSWESELPPKAEPEDFYLMKGGGLFCGGAQEDRSDSYLVLRI